MLPVFLLVLPLFLTSISVTAESKTKNPSLATQYGCVGATGKVTLTSPGLCHSSTVRMRITYAKFGAFSFNAKFRHPCGYSPPSEGGGWPVCEGNSDSTDEIGRLCDYADSCTFYPDKLFLRSSWNCYEEGYMYFEIQTACEPSQSVCAPKTRDGLFFPGAKIYKSSTAQCPDYSLYQETSQAICHGRDKFDFSSSSSCSQSYLNQAVTQLSEAYTDKDLSEMQSGMDMLNAAILNDSSALSLTVSTSNLKKAPVNLVFPPFLQSVLMFSRFSFVNTYSDNKVTLHHSLQPRLDVKPSLITKDTPCTASTFTVGFGVFNLYQFTELDNFNNFDSDVTYSAFLAENCDQDNMHLNQKIKVVIILKRNPNLDEMPACVFWTSSDTAAPLRDPSVCTCQSLTSMATCLTSQPGFLAVQIVPRPTTTTAKTTTVSTSAINDKDVSKETTSQPLAHSTRAEISSGVSSTFTVLNFTTEYTPNMIRMDVPWVLFAYGCGFYVVAAFIVACIRLFCLCANSRAKPMGSGSRSHRSEMSAELVDPGSPTTSPHSVVRARGRGDWPLFGFYLPLAALLSALFNIFLVLSFQLCQHQLACLVGANAGFLLLAASGIALAMGGLVGLAGGPHSVLPNILASLLAVMLSSVSYVCFHTPEPTDACHVCWAQLQGAPDTGVLLVPGAILLVAAVALPCRIRAETAPVIKSKKWAGYWVWLLCGVVWLEQALLPSALSSHWGLGVAALFAASHTIAALTLAAIAIHVVSSRMHRSLNLPSGNRGAVQISLKVEALDRPASMEILAHDSGLSNNNNYTTNSTVRLGTVDDTDA